MNKQNDNTNSKSSSYVLKTWETLFFEREVVHRYGAVYKSNTVYEESEKINEKEKIFDDLDVLKNSAKLDIFRMRTSGIYWCDSLNDSHKNDSYDINFHSFSILNIDTQGTEGAICHSYGNKYSENHSDHLVEGHFVNTYYKVEDENGKTVLVDWSELKDFFDKDKPDSGTGYYVCDYLATDDESIKKGEYLRNKRDKIIIGKYDNWRLPNDIIEDTYDEFGNAHCDFSIHKTLDECFDHIKKSYDKLGKGQYESVLSKNVIADKSLGPVDLKDFNNCILKDSAQTGVNKSGPFKAKLDLVKDKIDSKEENEGPELCE